MKTLIFALSIFLSASAQADIFTCVVPKTTEPTNWPDSYVKIQTKQDKISSVHYVQQIPKDDGSFTERPNLVYDGNHRFYEISNCQQNENEYLVSIGFFDLYSECSVEGNKGNLVFTASMSTKHNGRIMLDYFPDTEGGMVTRRIPTEPCQLLTAP